LIKYLGSKRRLVPVLTAIAEAVQARTALDLFTGTTRVAQAFRRNGAAVTAVDTARCAHVLAQTYVATELDAVRRAELADVIESLQSLPGFDGYVTDVFCRQARFFQPHNGARIDAVREAIARDHAGTWREPVLLTALIEAADRVDSTTGLQMAYLKSWAPRASKPLELRVPAMPEGPLGVAVRADAVDVAGACGPVDVAYLDPPYNQHRYDANYHVWETIVAWDAPAHYGVACKRQDLRDPARRSTFNERRRMPAALRACIEHVDARVVVLSYNDEAWIALDELVAMCASRGPVEVLAFDSARYVGARIGIHDPQGRRVGTVSHVRNTELVLVAGDLSPAEREAVRRTGHDVRRFADQGVPCRSASP